MIDWQFVLLCAVVLIFGSLDAYGGSAEFAAKRAARAAEIRSVAILAQAILAQVCNILLKFNFDLTFTCAWTGSLRNQPILLCVLFVRLGTTLRHIVCPISCTVLFLQALSNGPSRRQCRLCVS